MTGHDDKQRLEELAAIAAVEGLGVLDVDERAELDEDLVREFEIAAGAIFSAHGGTGAPAPPAGMLERLEDTLAARAKASSRPAGAAHAASDRNGHSATVDDGVRRNGSRAHGRPDASDRGASRGLAAVAGPAASHPAEPSAWPVLVTASGWATAAALAIGLVLSLGGSFDRPFDPNGRRVELSEVAKDTQVLAWADGGPKGDVTWSDELNEGYMRIDGLPVNDPTESQYQLWIFRTNDPTTEPHPVDGGVFDVTTAGEVIVPIDPKIGVDQAFVFAVTVEQPGGVVVSDRQQIVALAAR